MKITGIPILIILISGCERLPEPLSANGAIAGGAYADSSGHTRYGVTVKSTGPYGVKSLINKTQNYKIEGLGNGTYDLEFSKTGYGTVRQYGIQIFGGETVNAGSVTLFSMPSLAFMPILTKAYPVNAANTPSNYTNVKIEMSGANLTRGLPIMLFMSNSRNVAWDNYDFLYSGSLVLTSSNITYIYVSTVFPFEPGSEVFIKGYLCNTKESGYFDTYRGKQVFSTLDKSRFTNVVSFIMP